MSQSPHQLMYNLYNIIALTEVKGYAMVQFSYMMLRIYNKVRLTTVPVLLNSDFGGGAGNGAATIMFITYYCFSY
jgi:Domain of unknown function (DUF4803)